MIIIVDATKLTGTTWQQLADYLAVVSLAQINPKTNPAAFDSILNLFSNPAAYSGLTDWDRSYFEALYDVRSGATSRIAGERDRQPHRGAGAGSALSKPAAAWAQCGGVLGERWPDSSHQARQTVLNAASRSRANCRASMTGEDSMRSRSSRRNSASPLCIADQRGRELDVLLLASRNEVLETDVGKQRRARSRDGRAAREADDGHAHPQRIARRRASAIRMRVERDVDLTVGLQVVRERLAAHESRA